MRSLAVLISGSLIAIAAAPAELARNAVPPL